MVEYRTIEDALRGRLVRVVRRRRTREYLPTTPFDATLMLRHRGNRRPKKIVDGFRRLKNSGYIRLKHDCQGTLGKPFGKTIRLRL